MRYSIVVSSTSLICANVFVMNTFFVIIQKVNMRSNTYVYNTQGMQVKTIHLFTVYILHAFHINFLFLFYISLIIYELSCDRAFYCSRE